MRMSRNRLDVHFCKSWKTFFPSFIILLFFLFSGAIHSYGQTTNIMIVLDASGSMREQQNGRTKMDIAKAALKYVLQSLPDNVRVGLRVYGHQSPRRLHDCEDSKLEIPLDYLDYQMFSRVLDQIQPKGYTPLAYSLQKCKNDFFGEGRNFIICLTDGIETCGGNPCAIADSLRKSDIQVTIHVVGFDVGKQDREILMCIPRNSGGQYFSAENPKQLRKALEEVFDLSINPGYIRLKFADISKNFNVIFARIYNLQSQYLFVNATTTHPVPLPPGVYNLSRFFLWSNIDSNPYFPEDVSIENVRVKSGEETDVSLDQFAIVNAFINFPKQKPEQVVLSFHDLDRDRVIPDRIVDTDVEAVLLKAGRYDFTCALIYPDRRIQRTLKNQEIQPQTVNNISFKFKERKIPSWLYWLLLLIPGYFLAKFLIKLEPKNKAGSTLEEFAQHPEKFKGKYVDLQLRVNRKELGYNKNVTFWRFYPVQLSVEIFIPPQFRDIVNFDDQYMIKLSFFCRNGKHDNGNILISYKRGKKIR